MAVPPSNFLSGMDEFPNQSTVTSLSFHAKTRHKGVWMAQVVK